MKATKLLLLILATTLFINGCSKQNSSSRHEITSSTEQTETNPEPVATEQRINAGLKEDTPRNFIYNGEPIKMPYIYASTFSKSFGLMVLCNGIAVPFSTDKTVGDKTLHIIPTLPNGEFDDIEITFTPTGKTGETTNIQLVDIVEPDFNIYSFEMEDGELDLTPITIKQKLQALYNCEITVQMQADGLNQSEQIDKTHTKTALTKEEIASHIILQEDGTTVDELSWLNSNGKVKNHQAIYIKAKKGEKLEIEIEYKGSKGYDIVTSIYLNNEVYPAFNGLYYNSCFVNDKNKVDVLAVIDTDDLEVGRYSCYGVVGVEVMYFPEAFHTFILEVYE